ncbi:hypothetical protein P8629_01430 [Hydrogenovibrio sp. 3SP14C1]|uniref:hypothetical protein n=1 Tax=Hydrogenovibrio sp. 3SP14C1 TaxID=3038774 RepID=UPI00241728C8|nr:hypothetical protein [Hydrogenovibrio sp. 3SP14C1]MDG4811657.1 hypothetical protein [Hydrogenovibrio sp. 3SP14C1]
MATQKEQAKKQSYKVLKDISIENQTRKSGETLQLYPKQAVYLVQSGFLQLNKTTTKSKG